MVDATPFQEAERQYQWYTTEAQAGRLDLERYRAAINALRVTDPQGNLWMLQEGSGQWHLWLGDHWIAASPYQAPPAVAPAAPVAPVRSTYAQPQSAATSGYAPPLQASGQTEDRAGCLAATLKAALAAIVIFAVIGGALMLFVDDFPPEGLYGIALAVVISVAISFHQLNKHWEGVIVDLHVERVRVSSGDDDDEWADVLFALIREPSGKTRKERAQPDWRVGNHLRKRQGKSLIENLG